MRPVNEEFSLKSEQKLVVVLVVVSKTNLPRQM